MQRHILQISATTSQHTTLLTVRGQCTASVPWKLLELSEEQLFCNGWLQV